MGRPGKRWLNPRGILCWGQGVAAAESRVQKLETASGKPPGPPRSGHCTVPPLALLSGGAPSSRRHYPYKVIFLPTAL
jgi:hypothetical protein